MIEDREHGTDQPSSPPTSSELLSGAPPGSVEDLERLRELLFGPELAELAELKQRLDQLELTPEEVADRLPQAVAIRTARDKQLARALGPTFDEAFSESVQRHPERISTAIFPILGPAIRKAIAETMAGLVQTINHAIEHSLSWHGMKWRVESMRTGVPYAQIVIKHALVYRVEQVFLIHSETGLLLAHVTAEDLETPDADVVSAMLTAITDFVQDSFHAESTDGMRNISVAQHTINVQQGPKAMLGVVLRGTPPEALRERLTEIVERVHLQFGKELNEFAGDSQAFDAAQPLLEEFVPAEPLLEEALETVLTTDLPERRRPVVALTVAWTFLTAIVLGVGWLWFDARRGWNRAVRLLDETPGIVVVGAERGWGGWELSGLWDPAAPHPLALLADSLGIDSSDVSGAWKPYLSFDPPVVLARAARELNAPGTVTFGFADGGAGEGGRSVSTRLPLVVSGSAPATWMRDAAAEVGSIPGIASLDLSAVTLEIPETLGEMAERLSQYRVTFAVGSAVVPATAGAVLDSMAGYVTALAAGSAEHALLARFEAIGRADTTGTNATNLRLSESRAAAIRNALIARGADGEYIGSVGIGASNAIAAADPVEAARANRSVEVVVRFELRSNR